MESIFSYFLRNRLLTNLTIVFLFLAGLVSILGLRRDSFPNVDIRQLVITTVFPGAPPEDVELRVTYPIEEKLKEITGIDEIRSVSRNSVSEIDVRVDLDDKDPDKVISEIRRAVDSVQDFPPQVTEKPRIVERKSGSFPIYEFSIYGGKDENELQSYALFLEDELEKVEGVARIDVFGKRDHEWHVLTKFDLAKKNNVSIMDVVHSIGGRSVNLPAGSFENEEAKDIRIDGEFKRLEEIGELPVRTNEILKHIRIKDIAFLKDTYASPKFLGIANGKPSLIFTVVKKETADAIQTVDKVKAKMKELEKTRPTEIQSFELNSEADRTKNRLQVVINNAILGFIIVFAILFIFMNTRTALLTSVSLPLSLLATFIFLPPLDVSFNLVSMMGIIIALGMLVDNSIVISENIYSYIQQGFKPVEAAVKGTSEMVVPIFGSYLTTVAAFMPMLFMSGVMGKFIYQIPLLVMIALTASLFESFILLPSRLSVFGKVKPAEEQSKFRRSLEAFFLTIENSFYKLIQKLIYRPFLSLAGIGAILILALFAFSKMDFILFPKEEIEVFLIKVEFNPALHATETREKIKPIESIIQSIPKDELVSYSIKIGVQQTEPNDPLSRYGEQLAIGTVFLTPEVKRKRKAKEIIDEIEPKLRQVPGIVSLYVEELIYGPPIGAAITLAILGKDYETLKAISKEIQDFMASVLGIINIRDDYKMGRSQVVVNLDHNLEILTGVSTAVASEVLRTAYDGNKVVTLRQGKEKVYIRVLYDEEFRKSPERIGEISIPNRYGGLTELKSIAKISEAQKPELLTHKNFERSIIVNADVDTRLITSQKANELVAKKFNSYLAQKYPGYSLLFGGEEKDTEKSMASLAKAGSIAIFGIFAILALTMNHLWKPLAILSCIPLGIIGIVIGFPLSGKVISFIAMIGIIGLAGVLVNASIVLVDCIDQTQKQTDLTYEEVLIEATRRRFRPILLTTFTTMGGLLPTAYSIGGSDPVLIPMTLALGWGLGFGTLGSLIYIPVLFASMNRVKNKKVIHEQKQELASLR